MAAPRKRGPNNTVPTETEFRARYARKKSRKTLALVVALLIVSAGGWLWWRSGIGQRSEVRSQRSEVRGRRTEVGGQRSAVSKTEVAPMPRVASAELVAR